MLYTFMLRDKVRICIYFEKIYPNIALCVNMSTSICTLRWWAGPWQHCSVTCGNNGVHRRTVICVRSLGSDEQIALDDHSCQSQPKPTEVDKCHPKDPCPGTADWVVGDWTLVRKLCQMTYTILGIIQEWFGLRQFWYMLHSLIL